MKKLIIKFMAACFIMSLTACAAKETVDTGKESWKASESATGNSVQHSQPDPLIYPYDFQSYEELLDALSDLASESHKRLIEEQENYTEVYRKTLSLLESGEIQVYFPKINGENLTLRDKKGFFNIAFFTYELYGLPVLWYFGIADEYNLDIKTVYPSALGREEVNQAETFLEVLSYICPDAPTPANAKEFPDYRTIDTKDITLSDGNVVEAVFLELADSSKMYVQFYYKGIIWTLHADKGLFTDTFWKKFAC